jgi:COP9 signalosome complex subunit 6
LQTKYNAIKMLRERLALITNYLKSQPASYLTDSKIKPGTINPQPNYEILRAINALAGRLQVMSLEDLLGLQKEVEKTRTDAELVNLLSSLTQNVIDVKLLGKHWQMIENKRRGEKGAADSDLKSLVPTFAQDA